MIDEKQYKNLHEKIQFRHTCGFVWETKPTLILHERAQCPKCALSLSRGEAKIKEYLNEQQIQYIPQWKQFINGHYLFFDFFLPNDNLVIEFQGEQHYKPIEYFGGEKAFETRKKYDQYKKDWCKKNGFILLEISWQDITRVKEILKAQRLTSSSESYGGLPKGEDDIV